MVYSLQRQRCETAFDAMKYTIASMKECGYSSGEIDDYIVDAISSNNTHLVDVSIEALDECNKVLRSTVPNDYEDSWRDYYYSNDNLFKFERDDVDYDSFEDRPKHYWEDEDDELEAYEGFDCCTNHQYWYDPDEDEDEDVFNYLLKK